MNRAARISWWLEQARSARRAIVSARVERRRAPGSSGTAEGLRTRVTSIASSVVSRTKVNLALSGETITGERDEERRRGRCHINLNRRSAKFGSPSSGSGHGQLATSGTLRLGGRGACGGM